MIHDTLICLAIYILCTFISSLIKISRKRNRKEMQKIGRNRVEEAQEDEKVNENLLKSTNKRSN